MHIGPTRFLKADALEIVFDIDRKFLEQLVIVEKICAKLIFSIYICLKWIDYGKFETSHIVNHKNNMFEAQEKNLKVKAKQLKNKKQ